MVNVLILKVKDIAIVAAKTIFFFTRSWIGLPRQICVCNTHKLCKLAQGKHRENTLNLKIQFEWVPWGRVFFYLSIVVPIGHVCFSELC